MLLYQESKLYEKDENNNEFFARNLMHINSDKLHLQVNSEVTTLNMYDCHGNTLEDLQPDDPVSIQLPRRPQMVGK